MFHAVVLAAGHVVFPDVRFQAAPVAALSCLGLGSPVAPAAPPPRRPVPDLARILWMKSDGLDSDLRYP